MCDSVPAAIVIDPTIITKKHRRFVDVELQGNITRGMTVIHWDNWNNFKHSRWGIPREHVDIIEEINTTQFWEMLISSTD